MKNGFFLVDKQEDITSFDTINSLKRRLELEKVGHSGTLDKFASGLLLVFSGKYSKIAGTFLKMDKVYESVLEFGYSTTTLDRNGQIEDRCEKVPTLSEIESIIPSFLGQIKQTPPKYSRISIDGKRAQQKAQDGEEFEMKEKDIVIYDIKINSYENGKLSFTTHCGSGTYIRSLGRDIALKCGSLGTIVSLRRTKIGNISLNEAKVISDISLTDSKDVIKYLQPSDIIELNENQKQNIENSMQVQNFIQKVGSYIAVYNGSPIAVLKNEKNLDYLRYSKLNDEKPHDEKSVQQDKTSDKIKPVKKSNENISKKDASKKDKNNIKDNKENVTKDSCSQKPSQKKTSQDKTSQDKTSQDKTDRTTDKSTQKKQNNSKKGAKSPKPNQDKPQQE